MQLEELFDYKNQLMSDILSSEEIVKLLNDNGAVVDDVGSLVYTQVFPYEYIPNTVENGHTFICCDVDVQKVMNKTFLVPQLCIWIFTHKSLLRAPSGVIRTDALCAEICKVINGSRRYGLGELNLVSVRRFAPIADYHGKVMTFTTIEYNRISPNRKETPNNRKAGM